MKKHTTGPDGQPKRMSANQARAAVAEVDAATKRLGERHKRDVTGTQAANQTANDIKSGKINVQKLKESYSDYELYQILESNGYTTTRENLSILKEGIESGKYIID